MEFDREENSIRPGLHSPRHGKHTVVWFDPGVLDLSRKRSMGLRYEEVLAGSAQAGLKLYREWKAHQAEIVEHASVPRFNIERATEAFFDGPMAVEVVRIAKRGTRPAGRAFGKLVHALIEQASFPVRQEDLQAIASVEARIIGSEDRDIEPAIQTALAALRHELLAAAAAATRVHREFPILLRRDGRMIEGVIDLAFLTGDGWTIVDFKTGPADKKRNRGQLELYRQALATATDTPVRAFLFEI
jgi:ATP-dependent exoDNAse (exonuclease V) beta subunit